MELGYAAAFGIYSFFIMGIGIIASFYYQKKQAATDHMALGGRTTHWLLTSLSAHAADMSDWLFMGLPAAVYSTGGMIFWIPIALIIGMFLVWHYIAFKLRIATEQINVTTLASYFKYHFKDTSGILVYTAALFSCVFFLIYISAGIKGIGYVLLSAFGIPYHIGIVISLVIILPYLLMGGFAAVAILDLFQGIFLLAMIMLVPLYAAKQLGSSLVPLLTAHSSARSISLALLPDFSVSTLTQILLNAGAWGLGYLGMPHILTKFMGTKNPHDIHKAKYVGIIWQFFAMGAALCVGVIGIAYFNTESLLKPEFLFISMAQSLFSPFIAGFVLCAILAATISTIDSQLLVFADSITEDLYRNICNPHPTPKQWSIVYHSALIAGALLGLGIAWNECNSIMSLVQYAWAGLGASFGPLVLVSLYSRYPNNYGACAGIITGGTVALLWDCINPYILSVPIYAMVPAFSANLAALYFVSWLTKKAPSA